ncbi:MAG: hypothetical protein FJ253_05800 [Phycisphaerae bacterium]|nr:hypothetical protein [Phycisphaerae bacterium]
MQRAIAATPAPADSGGSEAPIEVLFEVSDPDGDPVHAMLLYSPDGGERWAPVSVNADGGRVEFPPSNLPGALPGKGVLRLRASDGLNVTDSDGVIESLFMEGNPPDIHILSPNADTYAQGASVVLHASGWDMEDEYLPDASLDWWSDVDGWIGTGRLFTTRSLSPGSHLVTLVGVDSDGLSSEDTVTLTISPRALPGPDLNGDGVVDGDDLGTLLGNWGAFGLGDLDFSGSIDGSDLGILLGEWTQ